VALHVVGVALALVGAVIGIYGLAMFVNYRGAATHYLWRVWRSHERWSPVWRWRGRTVEEAMAKRPAFQRYFVAAVATVIGLGWLGAGIGLMTGWLSS
jgi:hypothetical protein